MRLVTVAGPPSVGKTALFLKVAARLRDDGAQVGVVKFDALSTTDDVAYAALGLPVRVGLSAGLRPDHFFVSNIDDCVAWGKRTARDVLIVETAGLCNRCSPHIRGVLAICVVDDLAGIHTPRKIGPMLRLADVVAITKGDIVSQAEREMFAFNVRLADRADRRDRECRNQSPAGAQYACRRRQDRASSAGGRRWGNGRTS